MCSIKLKRCYSNQISSLLNAVYHDGTDISNVMYVTVYVLVSMLMLFAAVDVFCVVLSA